MVCFWVWGEYYWLNTCILDDKKDLYSQMSITVEYGECDT